MVGPSNKSAAMTPLKLSWTTVTSTINPGIHLSFIQLYPTLSNSAQELGAHLVVMGSLWDITRLYTSTDIVYIRIYAGIVSVNCSILFSINAMGHGVQMRHLYFTGLSWRYNWNFTPNNGPGKGHQAPTSQIKNTRAAIWSLKNTWFNPYFFQQWGIKNVFACKHCAVQKL